jgi:hypothetical protein
VEHAVFVFPEVFQTELAIDTLGMNRSIMRDKMDKVRTFKIRAGDFVTFHKDQIEDPVLHRIQSNLWISATHNRLDRIWIVPSFVSSVYRNLGTTTAYEPPFAK